MSKPTRDSATRGLHVLADDDPRWKQGPVEQAEAACAGGAAVVQLRAKHATDSETLAWALRIRERTRATGALFIVNDRVDLALAADADGVHLGQEDLPPGRIPERVRERLLVGRSTHDVAQLRAAQEEPVDYVAFGPVFTTNSKETPWEERGLDSLAEAVALAAPRPLVAIGGVDARRVADVVGAGASGVAVISAVADAENPRQAVAELVRTLDAAQRKLPS